MYRGVQDIAPLSGLGPRALQETGPKDVSFSAMAGDVTYGFVLGNPGIKRLQMEISNAKQYVYKMAAPPIVYWPLCIGPL